MILPSIDCTGINNKGGKYLLYRATSQRISTSFSHVFLTLGIWITLSGKVCKERTRWRSVPDIQVLDICYWQTAKDDRHLFYKVRRSGENLLDADCCTQKRECLIERHKSNALLSLMEKWLALVQYSCQNALYQHRNCLFHWQDIYHDNGMIFPLIEQVSFKSTRKNVTNYPYWLTA